ncbi:MAG: nicotinamide-nucleotide amidohydrolase family protein, partial [Myxococcales bacterium]
CDGHVLPRLRERLAREPARTFRAFRVLKAVGIPESHLDALVKDLQPQHPDVRFGFRTHAPENHLKLLAHGASAQQAAERLAEVEQQARGRLGARLFGVDDTPFAAAVLAALDAADVTVALAESCTGGLCASLLTAVPGASRRLVASAVTYQEESKTALLGVPRGLVASEGAVSAAVTRALAQAARVRTGATIGLAVTGWAGPGGGTPRDPVGTVYLCLATAERELEERHQFAGDRERVRTFAAYQALELLRQRAGERGA